MGIVAEECGLTARELEGVTVLGELALDGSLRKVGGIVAHAASLSERGKTDVLLPIEDAREAARIPGIRAFGVKSLSDAVEMLKNRRK